MSIKLAPHFPEHYIRPLQSPLLPPWSSSLCSFCPSFPGAYGSKVHLLSYWICSPGEFGVAGRGRTAILVFKDGSSRMSYLPYISLLLQVPDYPFCVGRVKFSVLHPFNPCSLHVCENHAVKTTKRWGICILEHNKCLHRLVF